MGVTSASVISLSFRVLGFGPYSTAVHRFRVKDIVACHIWVHPSSKWIVVFEPSRPRPTQLPADGQQQPRRVRDKGDRLQGHRRNPKSAPTKLEALESIGVSALMMSKLVESRSSTFSLIDFLCEHWNGHRLDLYQFV